MLALVVIVADLSIVQVVHCADRGVDLVKLSDLRFDGGGDAFRQFCS